MTIFRASAVAVIRVIFALTVVTLVVAQLAFVACRPGLGTPRERNGPAPAPSEPARGLSIDTAPNSRPGTAAGSPSSTPSDAGSLPENAACRERGSLPSAPQFTFVGARLIEPPQGDLLTWERELLNAMWSWKVIGAVGLPAVSDDGRSVLVFEDARQDTSPPRFDVRIVEKDVEHTKPDHVTLLIKAEEFEAALPNWPEVKSEHPALEFKTFQSASLRFQALQEKVKARIERAQSQMAERKWVPMPWCTVGEGTHPSVAQVDTLVVSLLHPLGKDGLVLHVEQDSGPVVLERLDRALAARPHEGKWGRCTYEPMLSMVAADNARHVIVVRVGQVGSNDMCNASPIVGAYRLESRLH